MSIEIDAFHRRVSAAQLPLEKLAASSQCSPSDKVAEVSRQFEAILLRHILAEAQKPVFKSKTATESVSGDIYKDLLNNELADQVSRSGSLGLARALEKQLQRQLKTGDSCTPAKPPAQAPQPARKPTTPNRYD